MYTVAEDGYIGPPAPEASRLFGSSRWQPGQRPCRPGMAAAAIAPERATERLPRTAGQLRAHTPTTNTIMNHWLINYTA